MYADLCSQGYFPVKQVPLFFSQIVCDQNHCLFRLEQFVQDFPASCLVDRAGPFINQEKLAVTNFRAGSPAKSTGVSRP